MTMHLLEELSVLLKLLERFSLLGAPSGVVRAQSCALVGERCDRIDQSPRCPLIGLFAAHTAPRVTGIAPEIH